MEWWFQVLLGLVALVVAVILYSSRNYNYWKKGGIPYARPRLFFGTLPFRLFGKSRAIWDVDIENVAKHGKIHGLFEGSIPVIMISEPDLIRDITIKDFNIFPNRRDFPVLDEIGSKMLSLLNGEQWKRIRTKMSPAFSSGKMRKMSYLIMECAETTCKNFAEISETKKPYDVKKIFGAFTMDVIATTAFGTKLDSHHDPNNPFVKYAQKVFNQEIPLTLLLLFLFPKLVKFVRKGFFDPEVLGFFQKITENIIKERKENPEVKRYDFLQQLLDELNEENLPNGATPEDADFKGMTKAEIIAQCVLFFIAGYETTASTLSYCAYNLSVNPECQDKLAAEVDKAMSDPKFVLDYDGVKSLPYLNAVVSETLRVFPPATRTERKSIDSYKLGDTGIEIPKGMIVQIPIYAMHYQKEFFTNPEKFDPDRFLPENRKNIRPYTYMPFGAGPRNCLAERFALLEVKLCLAKVIYNFRFQRVPETRVPPKFYNNQGLMVCRDITLLVEKRR